MILKPRLELILKLTENTRTLLDVGCDHAYLSIEAVKRNFAESVIASDVNEGPLKKAAENIENAGLSKKISVKLGSGIEVISEGEADTVVMAGMGGVLITEILEKNPSLSKSVERYILQPMNSKEDLRKYLYEKGYRIVSESLCEERGKIYSILTVTPGECEKCEKEIFLHTGNLLNTVHTEKELILKYLDKTEQKFKAVNENLAFAKEENKEQKNYINMLLEELIWLRSEILKD